MIEKVNSILVEMKIDSFDDIVELLNLSCGKLGAIAVRVAKPS
ncbi:MAG: hypothetical protein V7K26_25485 [Nostoc sp.]